MKTIFRSAIIIFNIQVIIREQHSDFCHYTIRKWLLNTSLTLTVDSSKYFQVNNQASRFPTIKEFIQKVCHGVRIIILFLNT